MWHFCLQGSRVQIQSNFSKSAQLFLLYLPPARVKTWTRLCPPQGTRSGLQESWCPFTTCDVNAKKWHTGVHKTFLGFYSNFYSMYIMLKLIWQVKDCFQIELFFPLAVYTNFCSSPCQARLSKTATYHSAAVAACNAPQHHHKSLLLDRYICR